MAEKYNKELENLINNIDSIIFKYSVKEDRIIYLNSAVKKLTGYSKKEFYNSNDLLKNIIHPEFIYYLKTKWIETLKSKQPVEYEYQILDKHNQLKWFRQINNTVFDKNNEPIFVDGIITVITNFKYYEEKYFLLSESEPFISFSTDSKGKFTFISDDTNLLGYNKKELLGAHFTEIVHPNDIEIILNEIRKSYLVKSQKTENLVFRLKNKQNKDVWVELSSKIYYDKSGSVITENGIIKNITSKMENEELIYKHKDRLSYAQRLAHIGLWEWDLVNDEMYWSAEFFSILGYEEDEVIPNYVDFFECIHSEDIYKVRSGIDDALYKDKPFDMEYRIVLSDKRIKFIHGEAKLFKENNGIPVKLMGIAQDITSQKISEENMININKKLRKANLELKSLDLLKTNILSNVSHELRTPLVAIRGYTELILLEKCGAINETQKKHLNNSLRNINKLVELINNLLNFSKTEFGTDNLQLSVFDIITVIKETINLIKDEKPNYSLNFKLDSKSKSIKINADKQKMKQVFHNLLDNAVKFSDKNYDINIDVEIKKGMDKTVKIFITDYGIGIEKEYQAQIFDRFYQVDSSTTRKYGGVGLGLAMCKSIITTHGGQIYLKSTPGKGSTFVVSLPTYK